MMLSRCRSYQERCCCTCWSASAAPCSCCCWGCWPLAGTARDHCGWAGCGWGRVRRVNARGMGGPSVCRKHACMSGVTRGAPVGESGVWGDKRSIARGAGAAAARETSAALMRWGPPVFPLLRCRRQCGCIGELRGMLYLLPRALSARVRSACRQGRRATRPRCGRCKRAPGPSAAQCDYRTTPARATVLPSVSRLLASSHLAQFALCHPAIVARRPLPATTRGRGAACVAACRKPSGTRPPKPSDGSMADVQAQPEGAGVPDKPPPAM
jgi:hypothetical protein